MKVSDETSALTSLADYSQRRISDRIFSISWSTTKELQFLDPQTATLDRISDMANKPFIEYAHPDWNVSLADHFVPTLVPPNDPLWNNEQWNISSSPQGASDPVGPWTWWTIGSPEIKIGVIDTGKTSHPDLIDKWHPFLEYNAANPSMSADDNGNWRHGSFVSSIAAGATHNNEGVASVCPLCTLVPIKVSEDPDVVIQLSSLIDAIDWGTSNGIEILNLSLEVPGISCNSPQIAGLRDVISAANQSGIHIVAAAGNQNSNAINTSPASCPGVISVGALDRFGRLAPYSNYGAVDLVAPAGGGVFTGPTGSAYGEGIGCPPDSMSLFLPFTLGAVAAWTTSPSTGNVHCYRYLSGTSMAAPFVSGIIGLMLSANYFHAPFEFSPSEVEQMLQYAAVPIPAQDCPGGRGAGVVDVISAVLAARQNSW